MKPGKSKTLATWLALLAGAVGAHRYYLYGMRDRWLWLHALASLAGLVGVRRMEALGQDDRLAWLLIPWLGLSLSAAALAAIVYGLTSDERWSERFGASARPSGWPVVIGVVLALMLGGTVLVATIAFSAQRYFEAQ